MKTLLEKNRLLLINNLIEARNVCLINIDWFEILLPINFMTEWVCVGVAVEEMLYVNNDQVIDRVGRNTKRT